MEMGIFNITQWVYFTFNYPEPKRMFDEIFGSLSDHIYNKWLSYGMNFNRLVRKRPAKGKSFFG